MEEQPDAFSFSPVAASSVSREGDTLGCAAPRRAVAPCVMTSQARESLAPGVGGRDPERCIAHHRQAGEEEEEKKSGPAPTTTTTTLAAAAGSSATAASGRTKRRRGGGSCGGEGEGEGISGRRLPSADWAASMALRRA